VIASLPFTDSVGIAEATIELGEPIGDGNYQGRSVWYSYTPTANAMVRIDPGAGGGSPFMVVYRAGRDGFAGLDTDHQLGRRATSKNPPVPGACQRRRSRARGQAAESGRRVPVRARGDTRHLRPD
jgi:hypothetical protein